MEKKNYKLVIAYDGTHYSGWQIQPNAQSIQENIEAAIYTITQKSVRVIGSGRTDAGVHAYHQVANFKYEGELNLNKTLVSLNGLLPTDIRIKTIEEVPLTFHAQYSATSKTYHYHIHLDPILDPFTRAYCYHFRYKIDKELLRKATKYFIGTHDFSSFANERHAGSAARNSVRTMKRLDVFDQEGGIRLEFEADGFLYKMVRNICGVLLEVAAGKKQIDEIPLIFQAKDRRKSGRAVPARGLFLMDVHYDMLNSI